jgi:hypothetical protein
VEQYIYEGTITSLALCSDWVLSWNHNARNAAITTISNPGSIDLHVEARLNNTGGLCNN